MIKLLFSGYYDLSKYVIGRPRIKVLSSVINGSLYIPETTLSLRYERGLFDGSNPTFASDTAVDVYDDEDVLIFRGFLRSAATSQGVTSITLVSNLNKLLSGNVEYTAGVIHPAFILEGLLSGAGIPNIGITAWATKYPAMASVYSSTLSDNAKGSDAVSQLTDMMTMDLAVENGVVKAIPRAGTSSTYTMNLSGYPQLHDDGISRQVKGVSINYVFSGGLALSIGNQKEGCWSVDYGAGSNLQCYDIASAYELARARFDRFQTAHPVYLCPVARKNFEPALGSFFNVSDGPMQGLFRQVGYETDGKNYYVYMEAL